MDNLNILKNLSKEDTVLVKNVIDKYNKHDKTGINTYTNFLDIRQFKIVSNALNRLKIDYNVYKANIECEKSIIYFGDYDDFITIYKIENNGDIKHKDILGTLFNIGYDIDMIGDIFADKDNIYFTNLTRLNSYLEDNLYMIGNNYIKLEKTNEIILKEDRFIDITIVIPSYRLDVIVSKLAHMSRNDTEKYIKDKLVLVNCEIITEHKKIINIGDIISIRKVGKFFIHEELSKSRKDNYFVCVKKYN